MLAPQLGAHHQDTSIVCIEGLAHPFRRGTLLRGLHGCIVATLAMHP